MGVKSRQVCADLQLTALYSGHAVVDSTAMGGC
jgi:hypothetical protein